MGGTRPTGTNANNLTGAFGPIGVISLAVF